MKQSVLIIQESMVGGGTEYVLVSILKHLPADKYDITLLLIFNTGRLLDAIPDNVKVKYLFRDNTSRYTRLVYHTKYTRNLVQRHLALKAIGNKRFDVVVSFMEGLALRLHADLMHLASLNCSWIHCNIKTHYWYEWFLSRREEKEIYQKMDRIAFVSIGAKEAFESIYQTAADKVVIGNLQDSDEIVKKGVEYTPEKASEGFRLITVGRLVGVKRQELILEAVSILKKQGYDISLDILGIGLREKELKDLAVSLGIEKYVNFRGFVSNPYPYIKNADLFCLTSESEGYPMVVAEALITGTPVLSTRVNGVTEMLSRGGGIIVEGKADVIAGEIKDIIDNPQKLKKLKEETRQSAKQFDLKTTVSQIEAFITPRKN